MHANNFVMLLLKAVQEQDVNDELREKCSIAGAD